MTSDVASRSLQAERRAARSRLASPRRTDSRTREARGSVTGGIIVLMVLPIFQLVEQVQ